MGYPIYKTAFSENGVPGVPGNRTRRPCGAEARAAGIGNMQSRRRWIGAYDTFFLDWVLFANLPMFRLEGTEHMDEAYHQKWFHLKGMLFPGIVFALIPAAIVGLLIEVIR